MASQSRVEDCGPTEVLGSPKFMNNSTVVQLLFMVCAVPKDEILYLSIRKSETKRMIKSRYRSSIAAKH